MTKEELEKEAIKCMHEIKKLKAGMRSRLKGGRIMTMSDIIDKAKVLEEENKVLNQNLEDAEIVNKVLEKKVDYSKEIIQKLIGLYFYPITTEDDLKKQKEIIAEAKDFIGGKND